MTKAEAVQLFGSVTKLAKAMGISRGAYYKWTDPLPQPRADQVRGAYLRHAEELDRKIIHSIGGE